MYKKRKTKQKGLFNEIIESLLESIRESTGDMLEKITDFTFLKLKIKKYAIFSILSLVSLIIILHGISLLISSYFSLESWITYISLGTIIFLIGWAYLKTK